MRHLLVALLIIVVVLGGLGGILTSCGHEENGARGQDGASIPVVDTTGNEATSEAYMLSIKNEVDSLDERGEYKLAYSLIDDCLARHYSLDNMQYALEHAERHLFLLRGKNTISQKTVFIYPKGMSNWEMVKEYFKINGAATVAELLIPGGSVIALPGYWNALNEADKANYKCATEQEFSLVEKEKANIIISQYETARESVRKYLELLSKSYPAGDAEEAKQAYFTVRDRAETLKKNLIDARCNYISYQVISPALAEVSKEHYIATFKWLELDDKQKIKNSITLLTHSFHNEWLFTSTEEVRMQYCEVVKALKNDVGKAEWEQYQIVTTMLDSNDPSKPRGAEAWWGR